MKSICAARRGFHRMACCATLRHGASAICAGTGSPSRRISPLSLRSAAIARVAGLPGRARLVGWALRRLPENSAVPWHRIVGAAGTISGRGRPAEEHEQRLLLEDEGVVFDARGRLSLAEYQWENGRELE